MAKQKNKPEIAFQIYDREFSMNVLSNKPSLSIASQHFSSYDNAS